MFLGNLYISGAVVLSDCVDDREAMLDMSFNDAGKVAENKRV